MPLLPSEPHRCHRPVHRLARLAALLCFLLLALPATADGGDADSDAETAQRPPTVSGLLELLQAEMSEDVVLLWLETREAEVAPPSADDLLELRNAGASDAILQKLLRRAAGEPAADSSSDSTSPAAETPSAAAPSAETPSAETPAEPPSPAPATGDALVDFTLSYVPDFRPDEKHWNLYVYLDGKPLSFVSEGSRVLGDQAIKFQQALEPGPHQIRIAQEIHEVDEDADSFEGHFHEARMAPTDLFFRLEPGRAEVEISFERPLLEFRSGGPITYRVAQNGRVVISQDVAGGDPDSWTPLCDDARLGGNGAAGETPPRGCRDWAAFWTVDAPPRHEVLRALSLFDYRPVPRNQKLH